jgi:hypothetical protein
MEEEEEEEEEREEKKGNPIQAVFYHWLDKSSKNTKTDVKNYEVNKNMKLQLY